MLRDELVHLQRAAERREPLVLIELCRRALLAPVPRRDRVVVQRRGVHPPAHAVHQDLGPRVVEVAGPARDAVDGLRPVVVLDEGVVLPELVRVVLGPHVAAAAPGLVADAEVRHPPRLLAAVLPAEVGHRGDGVGGQVLDPLHHFLRGAAADVAGDVGVRAELLHEIHELVGAKAVILDDAAPVRVDHRRALLARPDAVLPVVLVGEAAAGPAQDGDVQRLERRDDVVPDARVLGIGEPGPTQMPS